MIRDFWVKNYLSIRDKQELSFVAKGPSSELVTEVADGVFLYKLGILYGSNASGKSNMLIAMNEVFRLLVIPKSDATVEIGGCIPFVLTKDEPTEMHVSFYADGTRYDYDVTFNGKHILSEACTITPINRNRCSMSVVLWARMYRPTSNLVRASSCKSRRRRASAKTH